ncbi:MAG: DUF2290 domain-containing protein [Acidobacteria bacterium]|nr:DUF2290 domain-containing protein [Acidobacteriota bacterium]
MARLNAVLLEGDIAIAVNPAIRFPVGEKTRLSWPNAKQTLGLLTGNPFGCLSEYLDYVRGGHYTSLLFDGALLQLSFDFKHDQLVGHRYCYYPCPLAIPDPSFASNTDAWVDLLEQNLFTEIELSSLENASSENDMRNKRHSLLRLRSPIRFDFSPDAAADGEPVSHVHLNSADARIPVHSALSIKAFIRFVITHFYPKHLEVVDSVGDHAYARCISLEEERNLYINCRATI